MMIPKGLQSEKCDFGNTFDCKEFESKHPVIHHGKRTKDSRNDILSLYYLGTTKCECRKYYHGEEDKLVRVSAAPAQPQAKVNFLSVDLLNEYLTCKKCPGPLRRGEKEEHFEGVREVHITDGIDMGCLQNERKGVVDENLFKVPTVDSGEVFDTSTIFTIWAKKHISTFFTIRSA